VSSGSIIDIMTRQLAVEVVSEALDSIGDVPDELLRSPGLRTLSEGAAMAWRDAVTAALEKRNLDGGHAGALDLVYFHGWNPVGLLCLGPDMGWWKFLLGKPDQPERAFPKASIVEVPTSDGLQLELRVDDVVRPATASADRIQEKVTLAGKSRDDVAAELRGSLLETLKHDFPGVDLEEPDGV
jgi:hypothetical protein